MSDRLFIIGDSFASASNDGSFYGKILKKSFPDLEVVSAGIGSRDIQSIIDDWIKIIPYLDEKDYLIISIPAFSRTRLPLAEKEWGEMFNKEILYKNKFIGTASYKKGIELEFFGNTFDSDYFESMMNPQKIINATKAAEKNFFEIIGSLKKLTLCKMYIFSWVKFEDENAPFDDYDVLFRKIGVWRTIGDLVRENGGPKEWTNDFHWEGTTHTAFAEMIKKEFGLKRDRLI
jgi:hypothetical protein